MFTRHYLGIGVGIGIVKNGKKRKTNKSVIRTKEGKLCKEEGDDRLSELPDSLILYILSLTINKDSCIEKLQTSKDVVKTCILSKRWQFLWTGMSEIDLYESSNNIDKISHYVSFVGRVLDICRVNHLHRFSVGLFYDESFAPNLNNWVQIAVERNVKDISLTSYGCMKSCYELPQILYSHSSLTTLSVSCLAMTPRETIIWQSLKSLSITNAKLSDCVIEEILSGCPVLEALRLKQCSGFTCLNIYSTTFTTLEIEIGANNNTPTIDISAPYARELNIKYAAEVKKKLTQFRLRDITSLVRASIDFSKDAIGSSTEIYMVVELLQSLQYVKELDLGDGCIEFLQCMYKYSLSRVSGLKIPPSKRRCLTLKIGYYNSFHGVLRILKSLPYLETLIIKGCIFDDNEDLKHSKSRYNDLVFNHLKTVDISLARGNEVMILAKFLLKRANVLQKMTLSYEPYFLKSSKRLRKELIALPRSSPEAIVVVKFIPLC